MPEPVVNETPKEIKAKKLAVKKSKAEKRLTIQQGKWEEKKKEIPDATADAMKTLFVARLARDITEQDIKDEFEYYGNIIKVKIVKDKKGISRGYGFVEFESSRDLREAYKDADGRKIHQRRILVDVERGRTVKNWRPRRLGGGLGATRVGGKDQNQRYSGRVPNPAEASSSSRSGRSDRRGDDRRGRDSHRDRDRGRKRSRSRSRGRDRDRDDKRRRR